jgi:hypothetical protein
MFKPAVSFGSAAWGSKLQKPPISTENGVVDAAL